MKDMPDLIDAGLDPSDKTAQLFAAGVDALGKKDLNTLAMRSVFFSLMTCADDVGGIEDKAQLKLLCLLFPGLRDALDGISQWRANTPLASPAGERGDGR